MLSISRWPKQVLMTRWCVLLVHCAWEPCCPMHSIIARRCKCFGQACPRSPSHVMRLCDTICTALIEPTIYVR